VLETAAAARKETAHDKIHPVGGRGESRRCAVYAPKLGFRSRGVATAT
jgi:hypothetical protein